MDTFFSRVEQVIKTLLKTDAEAERRQADTFYSEAWEELEEYLRTGESPSSPADQTFSGSSEYEPQPEAAEDYRNLELEPDADFATVKQAYRRLMRIYHPDRYAGDPKRQRVATEISAKLNASFNRIRVMFGD